MNAFDLDNIIENDITEKFDLWTEISLKNNAFLKKLWQYQKIFNLFGWFPCI